MALIVKVLHSALVGALDDKDLNGPGICVYLIYWNNRLVSNTNGIHK